MSMAEVMGAIPTLWDDTVCVGHCYVCAPKLRRMVEDRPRLLKLAQDRVAERMALEDSFDPVLPPGTVLILSGRKAWDVPDADSKRGSGGSDPYMRFTLGVQAVEVAEVASKVSGNSNNPDWSRDPPLHLLIEGGAQSASHLSLTAVLLDKDFTNDDDALAQSTLKHLRVRRGPQSMGVTLKGLPGWPDVRMQFEYELVPPEGFVWPP